MSALLAILALVQSDPGPMDAFRANYAAIKVDLDAAGIDEDEIDMTRTMIRQQMEMLKKTKGGEK